MVSIAACGADPALLALVMPDAKSIAGIKWNQSSLSPFGRAVMARIQVDADFNVLADVTGFVPSRDLAELVAATAQDGARLAVIGGVFPPDRIKALATATGSHMVHYRGIEMVAGEGEHPGQSLAFLDPSTVVIGNTDAVQAAIDRRFLKSQFSGALSQKAAEVGASHMAWFVTSISPADVPGPRPMQSVRQIDGGLKFGEDGVTFDAEAWTSSAEDAQTLVELLKAMASQRVTFLNAAEFHAEGPVLRFHLSLPEEDAEQLLRNR
jgi:hypothetical protein